MVIPEESKLVLKSKNNMLYGEYVRKNGKIAVFKLRAGLGAYTKTLTCDVPQRYDSKVDKPLFKNIYPISYSKDIIFNKSKSIISFFMLISPSIVTDDYRDRYCAFEHTGQHLGMDKKYDKHRYIFSLA